MTATGWNWYAGDNDEWFHVGPCATRDEAVAMATAERVGEFKDADDGDKWKLGFYVTEGLSEPLRIADWISTDTLVERAEEAIYDSDRVSYEHEDGPFFEATTAQQNDLAERVKRACDEWQAAHGLVFMTRTFGGQRSTEKLVVDIAETTEAAQ